MTISDTFKKTAIKTWFRLSDAQEMKMTLGEETITDINLLEISRARHPEISIKKFNKHEEGENGADWEFWLTGKSGKWIGLRIQAKIINTKSGEYEQLHYKRDGVKQTEKLIANAKKDNAIPLYCLYTMHDFLRERHIPCRCMNEIYGCSLVDAFVVSELKNKNHIQDLM